MKKNKKNGFTLVELLAVIVILAIVLVIAVPKVMSVIEDSKKATLESTAKMIASAAEKAKVQNTVLGKDTQITCDSVAKINKLDYEDCDIDFDDNTAKVTIKGSGKFAGLYICNGTKTTASATDEECSSSGNNANTGASFITSLLAQESTQHNGLVQTYATVNGEQVEAGIRYAGPLTGDNAVKNQVYFNCDDEYTSDDKTIKYGDEDYVYKDHCEVWRIIGVFDTKTSDNPTEKPVPRIKIVRDTFTNSDGTAIKMSWDSSASDINFGFGINQWGEVKDSSGNIIYEGADIMRVLKYFAGESSTCTNCYGSNQETCENDCSSSVTPLSDNSLSMIDNALWYTGATTFAETITLSTMYEGERSTQSGKICTSGDSCNDNVTRTTTWIGKVGLIYPSDYAYASTDASCASDIVKNDSTCNANNWLHPSSGGYWTISPSAHSSYASHVWNVSSSSRVVSIFAFNTNGVRPALYLASNVQIIGGDGNETPYKLK